MINVGCDSCKPHVLPDFFVFLEKGVVNDSLDVLSVSGIHPKVNLFMRKDDWHSAMNLGKFRSGIFGEYDDFSFFVVERCYKKVISLLGSEAEGFFLLVPFKISLHDDHTPIFDDVDKHPLIKEFFDPAIDDHVVLGMSTPFHVGQFSAFLVLHILVFNLVLSLFLNVKLVRFDHRDVSRGTHVIGTGVELTV